MIRTMTDRGLPIVEGAPACPFVAFEFDRDGRATSPDHRHRCYAEVRPAPRALAHQEAYCLSSAFPVCPTFQDWARREAAQARAAGGEGPSEEGPGEAAAAGGAPDARDAVPGSTHRNPPRDWAAPPPWLSSRETDPDEDGPEVLAQPPLRGAGLAGSFADRLAGGPPSRPGSPPARREDDEDEDDEDGEDDENLAAPSARSRAAGAPLEPRGRRPGRDDRRSPPGRVVGPSWERPRRLEAYPTIRSRVGLPSIAPSPVLVGVAAVVIAAVALFYLPALLGIGNPPDAGATATPTTGASPEASVTLPPPTPTPGPTQQVYIVAQGDTMSKIANRFGVPLQALIDANRETIPNPDVLEIGQKVIIPTVAPTSLPDAGTVTPAPSAAP